MNKEDEEYVSFERLLEDKILLCEKNLRNNRCELSKKHIAMNEGFISGLRHARHLWETCDGE